MKADEDHLFVRVGEEIEISLSMVPASGHDWRLVRQPDGIKFIADRRVLPANNEKNAGDVGSHIFRFRAVAVGTFNISFVLRRSWEKGAIRSQVFQVNVSD